MHQPLRFFSGASCFSLEVVTVWWTCLRSGRGGWAFIVRQRTIDFKINSSTSKYMLFVLEYLSGILALLIVTSELCFDKNKMLAHFYFPFNSGNGVSCVVCN